LLKNAAAALNPPIGHDGREHRELLVHHHTHGVDALGD
jgi:hypothetical protein